MSVTIGFTFGAAVTAWNNVDGPAASMGTMVADLLDNTGAATGIALANTSASSVSVNNSDRSSADAWGWPDAVWDDVGFIAADDIAMQLSGLTAYSGYSYIIELAGFSNSARDTDFSINGGTIQTYSSTVDPPPQPVSFSGTINADTLDILAAFVAGNTNAYCTGFLLTLSATASISDVNGGNPVVDGQSNVVVALSGSWGTITGINLKAQGYSVAVTPHSDTGSEVQFDAPDITAIVSVTAGIMPDTANNSVTLEVTDGTNTAAFDFVYAPQSGYLCTDISGSDTLGNVLYGWTGTLSDIGQCYHPDTLVVLADGTFQTDEPAGTTFNLWMFDSSDGNIKPHSIQVNALTSLPYSSTVLPNIKSAASEVISGLNVTSYIENYDALYVQGLPSGLASGDPSNISGTLQNENAQYLVTVTAINTVGISKFYFIWSVGDPTSELIGGIIRI